MKFLYLLTLLTFVSAPAAFASLHCEGSHGDQFEDNTGGPIRADAVREFAVVDGQFFVAVDDTLTLPRIEGQVAVKVTPIQDLPSPAVGAPHRFLATVHVRSLSGQRIFTADDDEGTPIQVASTAFKATCTQINIVALTIKAQ